MSLITISEKRRIPDPKISSIPVAEGAAEFPTWNYTVKDTAPVWAYVRTWHATPWKFYLT